MKYKVNDVIEFRTEDSPTLWFIGVILHHEKGNGYTIMLLDGKYGSSTDFMPWSRNLVTHYEDELLEVVNHGVIQPEQNQIQIPRPLG